MDRPLSQPTGKEHPHLREIPAGSAYLGGRDADKFAAATEQPRFLFTLQRPILLSAHPVTESEFAAFSPSLPKSELPVVNISWQQAQDYCDWLSETRSLPIRLPSEFEWEYACRAQTDNIFQHGDALSQREANFLYDESGQIVGPRGRSPVCSYPSNSYNLYDMLGNVCEWTSSTWSDDLSARSAQDSPLKVARGGAWDYLPRLLRCSWRDGLPPETRRDNLGFRIACDLPWRK